MADKISQFTIKMLIFEVNILDTSMKCDRVIDKCVDLSNLCCMPYLYTNPAVKMAGYFSNWPPKSNSSQLKCKYLK